MPTFYIRRILIQPVLLLLLVPAIYYYKFKN
jgi:exosortase F-associated protein